MFCRITDHARGMQKLHNFLSKINKHTKCTTVLTRNGVKLGILRREAVKEDATAVFESATNTHWSHHGRKTRPRRTLALHCPEERMKLPKHTFFYLWYIKTQDMNTSPHFPWDLNECEALNRSSAEVDIATRWGFIIIISVLLTNSQLRQDFHQWCRSNCKETGSSDDI